MIGLPHSGHRAESASPERLYPQFPQYGSPGFVAKSISGGLSGIV